MRSCLVLTGTVIASILYIYFLFDYFIPENGTINAGMLLRFKYQINHYLSLQPRPITVDDVCRVLDEHYNIPPEIFYRDRFIDVNDTQEIPGERLKIYAIVLNVSVDQLTQVREPELVYFTPAKPHPNP